MNRLAARLRVWWDEQGLLRWLWLGLLVWMAGSLILHSVAGDGRSALVRAAQLVVTGLVILADSEFALHRRDVEADISGHFAMMRLVVILIWFVLLTGTDLFWLPTAE